MKRRPYPMFEALCEAHGLPVPVREFKFHPTRKWRFDFFFEAEGVALEVDGGVWVGGRHTRGKGFISDMAKANEAQLMGYVYLRCVPADIESGAVFDLLRRALTIKRNLA